MKKPFKIWKLKRAAYGLGDAACNWYDSVLQEMMRIGCKKSIYESALFYMEKNEQLVGMSATHVDDFHNCGNEIFDKMVTEKINKKFHFGTEWNIDFRYEREGKLRFYFQFKKNFKFETYLDNIPREDRKAITKLRLPSHRLPIEVTRYQRTDMEDSVTSCERERKAFWSFPNLRMNITGRFEECRTIVGD